MPYAFALVVIIAVIAGTVLWRSLTLFHVSIRKSVVLVVYGRIPMALLTDIREVVRIAKVESGTIKAIKDGGASRIVCSGLDEATAQRVRNVCGPYPIAKLRHAKAIANPTLGQKLGIEWLAWREKR